MIVALDNGHGGMIGGQYQTAGKRSPEWGCGILYEGMFNRWIVNAIIKQLDYRRIPYFHISPELEDIALRTRVNRANKLHRAGNDIYVLSIHSNAGGGTGFEGFTSVGDTPSDPIAELMLSRIKKKFPTIKLRTDKFTDGDLDKEKDYFILKNTSCPAVLLELLFMDSKEDYNKLWNTSFHTIIVELLVDCIIELYERKN